MNSKIEEIFGVDLRSLAIVRISVATIIILDLCERATDLEAHYSDFGLAPRSVVLENLSSRWFVSLHLLSGVWQVQAILFLIAGLLACSLLIGYKTRFATVASWAFLVSLNVRNFHIFAGGDMLLRAVLFWSMFLPWGACYSIDRAWANPVGTLPKRIVTWGTVGFTIQIFLLYFTTALAKSGAQWWREGSAVYYAMSIDYLVSPLGHWLLQMPPVILKLMTWSVLGYEFIGPFFLLSPWLTGPIRTLAVFGFIVLHISIMLTLLIGVFPFIGIASIIFFLPSWFWDDLLPKCLPSRKKPISIYYDSECGFCLKCVRFLKAFILSTESQIVPANSNERLDRSMRSNHSWIVVDESGRQFLGYQGFVVAIGSARLFAWLVPILKFALTRRCGEKVFRLVAEHRNVNCPFPAVGVSYAPIRVNLSRAASLLAVGFTLYIIAWNIGNQRVSPFTFSERSQAIANLVGLDQKWEMFAPFPAKDDGWYVIPGSLKNGRRVDLNRAGAEIDWRKPKYISLTIKNHRWRKFFELLDKRRFLQPSFAGYLCRDWNRNHKDGETLEELEIIFMVEWTRPDFEYFEPRRISLLKYQCSNTEGNAERENEQQSSPLQANSIAHLIR